MYSHTVEHLHLNGIPIFGDFLNFFDGVPIFFTMSGFLIWSSVGRSRSFSEYLKKRFWRIYPELWVAVAVELVVLLALYDGQIVGPQFCLFAVGQGSFFQFWTPDCLRGYGCGCPNGSLWTICVLIQFYFFAYFVYKALHGRKVGLWITAIVVSFSISALLPFIESAVPEILCKLLKVSLIPYFWMFILAAYVAENKERFLPFLKKWWIVMVIGLVAVRLGKFDFMAAFGVLDTILLFLGLIGVAYSLPILNIKTDISYAIYIYHMTVVNALIQMGYMGNMWLLVMVFGMTCFIAVISTKTIGDWSRKMKSRLAGDIA